MIDIGTITLHARRMGLPNITIPMVDRDCTLVRVYTNGNSQPPTPEKRMAVHFAFYDRGPSPISGSAVWIKLGTEDLFSGEPVGISLHEAPAEVLRRVESSARG